MSRINEAVEDENILLVVSVADALSDRCDTMVGQISKLDQAYPIAWLAHSIEEGQHEYLIVICRISFACARYQASEGVRGNGEAGESRVQRWHHRLQELRSVASKFIPISQCLA